MESLSENMNKRCDHNPPEKFCKDGKNRDLLHLIENVLTLTPALTLTLTLTLNLKRNNVLGLTK